MKLVMDACSVILLAKATLLEKVLGAYDASITRSAYEEVAEGKKDMRADALLIERLKKEGKVKFASESKKTTSRLMKDFNMGKGEAATIAAALKEQKGVLTDNNQGRKAAQVNNLALAGSIEIVVDLLGKGKIGIDKAKSALGTLKREGWFDSHLIEKAVEDIENERG